MHERLIFPFGFLRAHLLRQIAKRSLVVMPDSGPGEHRVIAIGAGGAIDDTSAEDQLSNLLPAIDAAFLFTGMTFDRAARVRSHALLSTMLKARGISVDVVNQEAALAGLGSDVSVFGAMEQISVALLDRALRSGTVLVGNRGPG